MQIVIDIPEEVRVAITRMGLLRTPEEMIKAVDKAIQNGIPLPKEHGKLIDINSFNDYVLAGDLSFQRVLDDIPAVIEADKEIINE